MRVLAIVCLLAATAAAQPVASTLREANAAAVSGDWKHVDELVQPLLVRGVTPADLAEAHRLAGLAAYFAQNQAGAEAHFLAYLKIDLDGRLDPTLVPPEAVTFFEDVRARHAAELRAMRPRPRRYWIANLFPPWGQIQNGDHGKAIVVGIGLGAFAITNVTTYLVLRSWCTQTSGPGGVGASCDVTVDHSHTSASLRTLNIASGIGLIATYVYGVYDGVVGYRRRTQEQYVVPFATARSDGAVVGVMGSF
jgi:hypothetical protein